MLRLPTLLYALFSYAAFLASVAYFMAFLAGSFVPRTVDTPSRLPLWGALLVDVALVLLFAAQHSVMARPAFKRWWTRLVPRPIERSTYVLASAVTLGIVMGFWQGIDLVIWDVRQPVLRTTLWAMYLAGFTMVPLVSLMIDHFDLFGLRQAWLHVHGKAYEPLPFRTPLLYKRVRHPLYLAWAAAFWITPTMTAGHLLFAMGMTLYMGAAAIIEERDLVGVYGDKYKAYQRQVPMFVPRLSSPSAASEETMAGPPLR